MLELILTEKLKYSKPVITKDICTHKIEINKIIVLKILNGVVIKKIGNIAFIYYEINDLRKRKK
jgi:hypothetical protein